jgi:predicted dehydrogenase
LGAESWAQNQKVKDKPYRAAIIGLGMIGGADQVSGDALGQRVENLDGTHAAAYQRNSRLQLVAGASRDAGRRERFAARTGARTYPDWRDMIEREALDIVSVATYAPTHAEITTACARRGIPVIYCEKPVATGLPDAERMLAACNEHKALLVINHQRRFNTNHRRLQRAIAEGELGELVSAHLQWPTGRLGNVGTHALDGLLMLTRRRFQAVSGTLDLAGKPDCRGSDFHDPGGWGTFRLEPGLMVTVHAPDYGRMPFQTEINGTAGRAIVKGPSVTMEYGDGRIDHWPAPTDGISGMDRAMAEIVACLDQQIPFPYAAEEAVHVLEAIVGFHTSHARNAAWTDLPLSGPDRKIEVASG